MDYSNMTAPTKVLFLEIDAGDKFVLQNIGNQGWILAFLGIVEFLGFFIEFAKELAATVKGLKPELYAPLDAKPEGLSVKSGAKFSPQAFAAVSNAKLLGQLSEGVDAYSVAFWFKNDVATCTKHYV